MGLLNNLTAVNQTITATIQFNKFDSRNYSRICPCHSTQDTYSIALSNEVCSLYISPAGLSYSVVSYNQFFKMQELQILALKCSECGEKKSPSIANLTKI